MTSESIAATSPQYADFDCTCINMVLLHPELGDIPFTASAQDVEPLGQDLHARAVAGEFGPIAPYDGPDPNSTEALAAQVRGERNQRLAQLDMLAANPLRWASFPASVQASLGSYRQALLDVPQQAGFPFNVNWPEMPEIPQGQSGGTVPPPPPVVAPANI